MFACRWHKRCRGGDGGSASPFFGSQRQVSARPESCGARQRPTQGHHKVILFSSSSHFAVGSPTCKHVHRTLCQSALVGFSRAFLCFFDSYPKQRCAVVPLVAAVFAALFVQSMRQTHKGRSGRHGLRRGPDWKVCSAGVCWSFWTAALLRRRGRLRRHYRYEWLCGHCVSLVRGTAVTTANKRRGTS
jgi:hypothetical protein